MFEPSLDWQDIIDPFQDFAAFSRPLTLHTRKDLRFEWAMKHQEAFDKLKRYFELPFILSCDTSDYGISAILSQKQNDKQRPISFASRVLNEHELLHIKNYLQ
jgi:hypothetical protein